MVMSDGSTARRQPFPHADRTPFGIDAFWRGAPIFLPCMFVVMFETPARKGP